MRNNLLIAIGVAIIAIAGSVATFFCLPFAKAALISLFFLFVALIAALVSFLLNAKNAAEKGELMAAALKNNDFSIRFLDKNNKRLGRALEKIAGLIKIEKQKILQSERYYELILNRVNAGIFVADNAGRILLNNNGILILLELNVFTHIDQLDRVAPTLKSELYGIEVGEVKLLAAKFGSGDYAISAGRSQISFDSAPVDIFVLNNIYPLINRGEMDSWVRLTRVLTHEIMNGIAPISSLSGQLINCKDKEQLQQGLEAIHSTSMELIKFTEDYRKFTLVPQPILRLLSVKELLGSAVTLFGGVDSHTEFKVTIESQELIINADKNLVNRVLLNLLKNGVEAGAKHILLSAYTMQNPERVVIDIADDGEPISQEIENQIFIPFFTTKEKGSGIGLSLSRRIMDAHNGSLQLIKPPKGSPYTKLFRLLFP